MAERITDTYDAATIAVMRQALGNPPFDEVGSLSAVEAGHRLREAKRLRRLDALARAQAEGMDIQVLTLSEAAQALWEERE